MSHKGRLCKFAKWVGLVASVLILTAWGVSTKYVIQGHIGGYSYVRSGDGTFVFIVWGFDSKLPSRLEMELSSRGWSLGLMSPKLELTGSNCIGRIPYWLTFLICALPTVLLFFLDKRKVVAGHCKACGYDLRSITSGRCPECGTVAGVLKELSAVEKRTL